MGGLFKFFGNGMKKLWKLLMLLLSWSIPIPVQVSTELYGTVWYVVSGRYAPNEKIVLHDVGAGMDPQAPNPVHGLPVNHAFNAEKHQSLLPQYLMWLHVCTVGTVPTRC